MGCGQGEESRVSEVDVEIESLVGQRWRLLMAP